MIPNENDKLENTGENTNFMQIGRTIECSNCKPEKGYADYHNVSKCDCKCHDMTQTNSQIREDKIEEEIRDILNEAYNRKDLGEKWAIAELLSYFNSLLKTQREEMIEKIENYNEEYTDKDLDIVERTVLGQVVYDIINIIKEQ